MRIHITLPDALVRELDARAAADYTDRGATICRLLAIALRADAAPASQSAAPEFDGAAALAAIDPPPTSGARTTYERALEKHAAAVARLGDYAPPPPEPPPPGPGPRPAGADPTLPEPPPGFTWKEHYGKALRLPRRP